MEFIDKELARYEQIALLIARDITRGAYTEGEKISGRSILAGKYGVSPETIRKALSLLQEQQVVAVVPGSGVYILSVQASCDFIGNFQDNTFLDKLLFRLNVLTKQRNKLNTEIDKLIREIVSYKTGMLKSLHNAEEIRISPGSWLIGKNLIEAQLRIITGATVVAVRRRGRWHVSPGKEIYLAEGDMLLVVGQEKAIAHLRRLAAGEQDLTGQSK